MADAAGRSAESEIAGALSSCHCGTSRAGEIKITLLMEHEITRQSDDLHHQHPSLHVPHGLYDATSGALRRGYKI